MERVELTRECEAVQVPLGSPITLEKGLEVFITQSLGGSFTVQVPAYGGLYRITGSLPRGLSLRTWIGEVALTVSNGRRL